MPDPDFWDRVVAEREGKIRLAIRVFIGGVKQSEERITASPDELDKLIPGLAAKHAEMMTAHPGMVEIEFLDEPDVNERFFRLGTDTSGMVRPMEVDPANPRDVLSKWKFPPKRRM